MFQLCNILFNQFLNSVNNTPTSSGFDKRKTKHSKQERGSEALCVHKRVNQSLYFQLKVSKHKISFNVSGCFSRRSSRFFCRGPTRGSHMSLGNKSVCTCLVARNIINRVRESVEIVRPRERQKRVKTRWERSCNPWSGLVDFRERFPGEK